jgi:hypothetical protein
MESDAPGMSAPAATELPAGYSKTTKRSSDIPQGEVDYSLPSLRKKKRKGKDRLQTPRTSFKSILANLHLKPSQPSNGALNHYCWKRVHCR